MNNIAENKINSSFVDLLKMGSPHDAEAFASDPEQPQASSDDAGVEVESVNLIDLDDGDGPIAQSFTRNADKDTNPQHSHYEII